MKTKKSRPLIDFDNHIRLDNISNISEIPKPDAVFKASPIPDEPSLIGILTNPVYCGIPPYKQFIPDEKFLEVTLKMCRAIGVVRYLNNIVYMLQNEFRDCIAQNPTKSGNELENLPIYLNDPSLDTRSWILTVHQEFKENPVENMKIILQSLRDAQFTLR